MTVFIEQRLRTGSHPSPPLQGGAAPSDTGAVKRRSAPDPCAAPLPVKEAARLALLRRLAAGAARSLNNALTAVLG